MQRFTLHALPSPPFPINPSSPLVTSKLILQPSFLSSFLVSNIHKQTQKKEKMKPTTFIFIAFSMLLFPLAVSFRADPPPVPLNKTRSVPLWDRVIPAAASKFEYVAKVALIMAGLNVLLGCISAYRETGNWVYQLKQKEKDIQSLEKKEADSLVQLQLKEKEVQLMEKKEADSLFQLQLKDKDLQLMKMKEDEVILTVLKQQELRAAIKKKMKKMKTMKSIKIRI